jgi:D-glycero-alpha-D-manno-heptose-7-phosphate kinase
MLVRSKAPLRLGIAGGGSDVSPYCDLYGGYVLNAAIDLYAYCTLEGWDCDRIEFHSIDRGEVYRSDLTAHIEIDGNLDLHKAIYNRIVRQFNRGEPLALKVTTYSDAPAGSGLGSSSTMVVAILKAYVEWLRLPLGEYEIARMAYEIERLELAMSGGRQDTYAATFGGFNFMEFYANEQVIVNPLRIKNWMLNELESAMILYYTDMSRESARIIDQQIQNVETTNESAIAATHELKQDAVRMKEAILKGNFREMAHVLGRSWEAKKRLAKGITNPLIDEIYERALSLGAYSGKISGAGGGGFIIFMVDPVKKLDISKALQEQGGRVTNFHFTEHGTEAWIL